MKSLSELLADRYWEERAEEEGFESVEALQDYLDSLDDDDEEEEGES